MVMKRFALLLLVAVFITACLPISVPDREIELENSSLKILEDQIASSKKKLGVLDTYRLIDSTRLSNLGAIIKTCDGLRGCTPEDLPDNWKSNLKNVINLSQHYFEFPSEELGNELENTASEAAFKFSITLSESVLLNGIYDNLVTEHKLFRKFRTVSEPGKSGFAKVYFIACLDTNNSEMMLGHDSTDLFAPITRLQRDIIKDTNGYYLVKPFRKGDTKGVIKFRLPNRAYEYYPFEIKQ